MGNARRRRSSSLAQDGARNRRSLRRDRRAAKTIGKRLRHGVGLCAARDRLPRLIAGPERRLPEIKRWIQPVRMARSRRASLIQRVIWNWLVNE